jgi:unsaturated rhamnogalacturonyl hydrolase
MRLRGWVIGASVAAAIALTGTFLTTQAGAAVQAAPTRAQIIAAMKSVDAYWIAHGPNQAANNWQNATFNVGNLAFVTTTGVANHYTLPWCQHNGFNLATDHRGPFFPDPEATGEVYLDMQAFHPSAQSLAALRGKIKAEVASVQAGHNTYWSYVDALNMAMPSFARIGVLDKSPATLTAMQTLFTYARSRLYNPATGLWWRDGSFRGSGTYWSRGNGWAIMALVKVLKALPKTDPRRAEYEGIVKAMAAKLVTIQRSDGFWGPDLGMPTAMGPETSGTVFFTFAITWGINTGLLTGVQYRNAVEKAWSGLMSKAVHGNGLLGYVQRPGSKPATAGPTDQAAYGVGGFLLAGTELARLEK